MKVATLLCANVGVLSSSAGVTCLGNENGWLDLFG